MDHILEYVNFYSLFIFLISLNCLYKIVRPYLFIYKHESIFISRRELYEVMASSYTYNAYTFIAKEQKKILKFLTKN